MIQNHIEFSGVQLKLFEAFFISILVYFTFLDEEFYYIYDVGCMQEIYEIY